MIEESLPTPTAVQSPMQVGVWNYYEEVTRDGFLFKNADVGIGAKLLKPWCDLHAHGQAHGIEFLTLDQVEDPLALDAVIFMDRPRAGRPVIDALMKSAVTKYLLIYECEVIKPDNWDASYHAQFDRVFTWHDGLADGLRYIKFNFAADMGPAWEPGTLKARFAQRKLASIIAGAKASNHPKELYSDRVRAIRWFEKNAPQDFDLFGGGWSEAEFPSYRGRVDDKLATLANYRFSICYENAKAIPGYITEKILDCLIAGTVPVYGGAPNITQWIPADCFIDIGQFNTFNQMHEHLKSMDATTHGAYLERIHAFLTGPRAKPFSIDHFVDTLVTNLRSDVAARRCPAAPVMQASTDAAARLRQSFREAGSPELIVQFGYGDELPVFQRARALWHFYMGHFPGVRAVFARTSDDLPYGEVREDGYDIVVGTGGWPAPAGGYADSGVWSPSENSKVIFRQMAVYRHLLARHPGHFYLYHATVTAVVDFRGLTTLLGQLPKTGCFAGSPARLNSPPELAGLTFTSGANSLFSRDVLELLLQRYDPTHTWTGYPNDVWQALVMQDMPRIPLPFFSFQKPRDAASRRSHVPAITERLLAMGHFHFRIKSTSAEEGLALREEVDPWIMAAVMEAILASPPAPAANRHLVKRLLAFANPVDGKALSAFSETAFFKGPRDFLLQDSEVNVLFPGLDQD